MSKIKLSNFWENYTELLNRIDKIDPSLKNDDEYISLWSYVDEYGIINTNLVSKEEIVNLLISSDIIGEMGTKAFDYTQEEIDGILSILMGDNEKAQIDLFNTILYKNIDLKFNGKYINFEFADIDMDIQIEIFDAFVSNKSWDDLPKLDYDNLFSEEHLDIGNNNIKSILLSVKKSNEDDDQYFDNTNPDILFSI